MHSAFGVDHGEISKAKGAWRDPHGYDTKMKAAEAKDGAPRALHKEKRRADMILGGTAGGLGGYAGYKGTKYLKALR